MSITHIQIFFCYSHAQGHSKNIQSYVAPLLFFLFFAHMPMCADSRFVVTSKQVEAEHLENWQTKEIWPWHLTGRCWKDTRTRQKERKKRVAQGGKIIWKKWGLKKQWGMNKKIEEKLNITEREKVYKRERNSEKKLKWKRRREEKKEKITEREKANKEWERDGEKSMKGKRNWNDEGEEERKRKRIVDIVFSSRKRWCLFKKYIDKTWHSHIFIDLLMLVSDAKMSSGRLLWSNT